MFVVKNMLLTEAVIPLTSRTVTKFEFGMFGVCSTADFAFVAIASFGFPFFLLPDGGLELDGIVRRLVANSSSAEGNFRGNIVPKEYEEVQQSHDGQKGV